jgi:excisionase family DNA binding protein
MTVEEVAERLLVSDQTILREIHEKKIQAVKIRGRYRIGKMALEKYEAACVTVEDEGTA